MTGPEEEFDESESERAEGSGSRAAFRAVSAVSATTKGKEPAVLKGRVTRSATTSGASKRVNDATESPVTKKKVGRPPKKAITDAEVPTVKRGVGRPRKDEKPSEEPVVKRGRGRPKKEVKEVEEASETSESSLIAKCVNEAILEVGLTGNDHDHDHESDVGEEDDGQEFDQAE